MQVSPNNRIGMIRCDGTDRGGRPNWRCDSDARRKSAIHAIARNTLRIAGNRKILYTETDGLCAERRARNEDELARENERADGERRKRLDELQ